MKQFIAWTLTLALLGIGSYSFAHEDHEQRLRRLEWESIENNYWSRPQHNTYHHTPYKSTVKDDIRELNRQLQNNIQLNNK